MKLLTLDELFYIKDAVCEEIKKDLTNIEDENPNIHEYKGKFKKEFKLGYYTIKYDTEVDADCLNNELYCTYIACEGEIRIFKKDKEIQAFYINEEIEE